MIYIATFEVHSHYIDYVICDNDLLQVFTNMTYVFNLVDCIFAGSYVTDISVFLSKKQKKIFTYRYKNGSGITDIQTLRAYIIKTLLLEL